MELDMLFYNLPRDKKQLFSNNPSGNFVAIQSLQHFQRVHTDFKPKPSDIYISTYPKNGTTWTIALTDQLQQLNKENIGKQQSNVPVGSTETTCQWVDGLARNDKLWASSLTIFEEMQEPWLLEDF